MDASQWTVAILPGQPGIPVPICVAMELNVATENAPVLHLLIMARDVSEILPKHEAVLTGLVQELMNQNGQNGHHAMSPAEMAPNHDLEIAQILDR